MEFRDPRRDNLAIRPHRLIRTIHVDGGRRRPLHDPAIELLVGGGDVRADMGEDCTGRVADGIARPGHDLR